MAMLIAGASGCGNNESNPRSSGGEPPIGGATLQLHVVGDPTLANAIRELRGEWLAVSGTELNVLDVSLDEARSAEQIDAVVLPQEHLGSWIAAEKLRPIPEAILESPELAWSNVLPLVQSQVVQWGGKKYAFPVGSVVFASFQRADILTHVGAGPPETWAEYVELAGKLADPANLDGLPIGERWSPSLEPLASGWAAHVFLARVAAYARHNDFFSTLFDSGTMDPLIAGEPFVRALEDVVACARSASHDQLNMGPAEIYQAFLAGECGLALGWPIRDLEDDDPELNRNSPLLKFDNSMVVITELPGSVQVFNLGRNQWETRYARLEHRVTYLGAAGRAAAVSTSSHNSGAAFRLLSWLVGPQWGKRISSASLATAPFRESQISDPSSWFDDGSYPGITRQYAIALQSSLSRRNSLQPPRIPGQERYMKSLDDAVRSAASGEAEAEAALRKAAEEWQSITRELGLDRQLDAYRRSIGI